MTHAESDDTELNYRIQERLGMLCGKSEPTEQQRKQATKEAENDLKRIEEGQRENP